MLANSELKIAIIGAGLGGLCLAQGLRKSGIHCKIFEKDSSLNSRTQGYRIRINKMGCDALSSCLPQDLYNLFENTCAINTPGVQTLDCNLTSINTQLVKTWSNGVDEIPDRKPNRITLREILMKDLHQNICFGKALREHKILPDDRVKLFFEDDSTYVADIVVAADGVHSKIGANYLGDQKIPTGNINIYGRTFYSDETLQQIAKELQNGTTIVFDEHFSLVIDAMEFNPLDKVDSGSLLTPLKNYFYWAFIGKPQPFGLVEQAFYSMQADNILQCIQKVSNSWNPQLLSMFQLCDKESLSITSIRTSLPKKTIPDGKITGIGDALHTMSPAGGLGANTAFKDAALLSDNITKIFSENWTIEKVLQDYSSKMLIYSNKYIKDSLQGGEVLYGSQAE